MKKETVLCILMGSSALRSFINLYRGHTSWMLFTGLSAFFIGLLCITPKKTLEERFD